MEKKWKEIDVEYMIQPAVCIHGQRLNV